MKQTLTISLILVTAFAISGSSCKKNADPLPDNPYGLPNATQTGANIFACRINGQNQIAKNSIYTINAWMSANNDTLNVGGQFGKSYYQFLNFGSILKDRRANLDYSLEKSSETTFFYNADSTCLNFPSPVINIYKAIGSFRYSKIDATNKIVSGTFNCVFVVPGCDSIKVTDGRFDIKYHY